MALQNDDLLYVQRMTGNPGSYKVTAGELRTNISYNDLTNKPTIGNATLNIKDSSGTSLGTFTANQNGTGTDITIPAGFSGDYNDLSNKPTIGNAKLQLRKGGSNLAAFTANQTGGDVVVDLFSGSYNDLTNKPNTINKANSLEVAPSGFANLNFRPIACFGSSATPQPGQYTNFKYPESNVPNIEGDGTMYIPKEIVTPLVRGEKGSASTKVTVNGVDFQNGNITGVDNITITPNGGINGFFISDQRTLKSQGSNAMDLSSANGRYNFYVATRLTVGITIDADNKEIKATGGNSAIKFTSTNAKYNFNKTDGTKGYQIDAESGFAGRILPEDAADPANYDVDGEYIGPVQDRVADLQALVTTLQQEKAALEARLDALEANEIIDDSVDSSLLSLVADLSQRVTALENP